MGHDGHEQRSSHAHGGARETAGNQTTLSAGPVTVTNPAFVNEIVVPNIADATTMAFLPDGRMLVGQLTETILIVQPGASTPDPTPFLQLDPSGLTGEQGLYDILLDPNFVQNGWYYVFYTGGRLARTETVCRGSQPAGMPQFLEARCSSGRRSWRPRTSTTARDSRSANDGKLYISTGDHLRPNSSQSLTSFRGKILRINKDGTIPVDNPFYDGAGPNRDAIWARGLRNPFRHLRSIQSRASSTSATSEETTTRSQSRRSMSASRGANYGWPMCEGACGVSGHHESDLFVPHNGRDASMTGGLVYRGNQFPSQYVGSYFFGDYAQNTLGRLKTRRERERH